jgi:hypothetical protein
MTSVRHSRALVYPAVLLGASLLSVAAPAAAQGPPAAPPGAVHRPVVVAPGRHDATPAALRDMPRLPPREEEEEPHAPLPVRGGPPSEVGRPDAAVQQGGPTRNAIAPAASFEGVGNISGVLPPDTVGDVGPSHYVQWVNLNFAIFDKQGSLVYGPASGASLWQGFNGACAANNDGDPVVLYDERANRWLMSQFALPNYPSGPYYQCIAVSQTGDPTGAYYRYQYSFSKLNDYPKFGVWGDGYYMTINQFSCQLAGCSWAGQGVAAFDRARMLQGANANMQYVDMASDSSLGGMLPADADGPTAPPAGGAPFVQFDDGPDQLQFWLFSVNWSNANASSFTRAALLPTASFDSNMCRGSRNCVPQPGTSRKLDAIADRLMYRLQYRNFGTYEAMVVNHTVDVGGDRAGLRWYELRKPSGGSWGIAQQGTYAPDDGLHRWMGSAAMDGQGNIAIGYSVANSQTFPSMRFTGRLATDPAGVMTITESDLQAGGGSQTHSASRWGDYAMLSVDPTDNCTFWFTSEYYQTTSSAGWNTHIGTFFLPGCGGTPPPPTLDAPSGLSASATSATSVTLGWTDNSGTAENGFEIERCTGGSCSDFSQIGLAVANATSYTDTTAVADTTFRYRVRAYAGSTVSGYSNTANATTPPNPTPSGTMTVGLSGSSSAQGRNGWRAFVTVTVHDGSGALVSGATVGGSFTNGGGSGSCTTDATGSCTIQSSRLSTGVGSVTFSVSSATHASLTWDGGPATTEPIVKP